MLPLQTKKVDRFTDFSGHIFSGLTMRTLYAAVEQKLKMRCESSQAVAHGCVLAVYVVDHWYCAFNMSITSLFVLEESGISTRDPYAATANMVTSGKAAGLFREAALSIDTNSSSTNTNYELRGTLQRQFYFGPLGAKKCQSYEQKRK